MPPFGVVGLVNEGTEEISVSLWYRFAARGVLAIVLIHSLWRRTTTKPF